MEVSVAGWTQMLSCTNVMMDLMDPADDEAMMGMDADVH